MTIRKTLAERSRQKALVDGQPESPDNEGCHQSPTKPKSPQPGSSSSGISGFKIPRKRKIVDSSPDSSPDVSPQKKSKKKQEESSMPFWAQEELMGAMHQLRDKMLSEIQKVQGHAKPAQEDRRWLTGIESKYKLITHMYVYDVMKWPYEGLCSSEVWEDVPISPVMGNLRRAEKFWAETDKAGWSTRIVREGYRIPFLTQPPRAFFYNNRSALEEPNFVKSAILKLLKSNLVERVAIAPLVVNPLSVAVQSSGKRRLILDVSPINKFIFKEHFKLEDYSVAKEFLESAEFAYSFDLEAAYNHLEIHPDSVPYLGFSWVFNGRREWFAYKVLCFGVSTGPYVFTKFLKPLVCRWRAKEFSLFCIWMTDSG